MGDEEKAGLLSLARKWIAQANHPMRLDDVQVRETMFKCADDLITLVRKLCAEAAAKQEA